MGFKTAQGSTAHAQGVLKIENLCATDMSGGQSVWQMESEWYTGTCMCSEEIVQYRRLLNTNFWIELANLSHGQSDSHTVTFRLQLVFVSFFKNNR